MPKATLTNPTVNLQTRFQLSEGVLTGTVQDAPSFQLTVSSAAGTFPTGTVDLSFSLTGTVTYGTPVAISLTNCLDPFANTVTFARITSMQISNTGGLNGNAGYLLTVGGGTHEWSTDVTTILAGGIFINAAPTGFGLAPGSADTITLTAPAGATGSNAVPFTITVLGRST